MKKRKGKVKAQTSTNVSFTRASIGFLTPILIFGDFKI